MKNINGYTIINRHLGKLLNDRYVVGPMNDDYYNDIVNKIQSMIDSGALQSDIDETAQKLSYYFLHDAGWI